MERINSSFSAFNKWWKAHDRVILIMRTISTLSKFKILKRIRRNVKFKSILDESFTIKVGGFYEWASVKHFNAETFHLLYWINFPRVSFFSPLSKSFLHSYKKKSNKKASEVWYNNFSEPDNETKKIFLVEERKKKVIKILWTLFSFEWHKSIVFVDQKVIFWVINLWKFPLQQQWFRFNKKYEKTFTVIIIENIDGEDGEKKNKLKKMNGGKKYFYDTT